MSSLDFYTNAKPTVHNHCSVFDEVLSTLNPILCTHRQPVRVGWAGNPAPQFSRYVCGGWWAPGMMDDGRPAHPVVRRRPGWVPVWALAVSSQWRETTGKRGVR